MSIRIVGKQTNVIKDDEISQKKTWSSQKINSKFDKLTLPSPSIDYPSSVNEGSVNYFTITNYDSDATYIVFASEGIAIAEGNKIRFDAPDIESNTNVDITVQVSKEGMFPNSTQITIEVVQINVSGDDGIQVVDFQSDEQSNDGFEYN